MLLCVVNVSEGRRDEVIAGLAGAAGDDLLDLHRDPDHHRSVLTLVGEEAPRRVALEAVENGDLATQAGVHPRIGILDVVPFVPWDGAGLTVALAARDRFADWAADALALPCFLYGPSRSLPEVRRRAWKDLWPDRGPGEPHPRAGAAAVGARRVLVAYNVWLEGTDLRQAQRVAAAVRGPAVRALGLPVAGGVQVSMNLVAPHEVGPAEAYDQVAALAPVARGELVGLVPAAVLRAISPSRWGQLDLDADCTVEARLSGRRGR